MIPWIHVQSSSGSIHFTRMYTQRHTVWGLLATEERIASLLDQLFHCSNVLKEPRWMEHSLLSSILLIICFFYKYFAQSLQRWVGSLPLWQSVLGVPKKKGGKKRGVSQGINVIPNGGKRLRRTNSSSHKEQSTNEDRVPEEESHDVHEASINKPSILIGPVGRPRSNGYGKKLKNSHESWWCWENSEESFYDVHWQRGEILGLCIQRIEVMY